jgi:hypothetical protein
MRRFILAALGFAPALGCNDKGDDSSGGEESDADTDADTDSDTDTDTDVIPEAECVDEGGACVLSGSYTESMRLTAGKNWLLRSGVLIGDDTSDVTLEIEPGTTVYGESASNGLLIITRGAKIDAEGTAASPIVFTSDQAPGSRARGDWGGIVLNGRGWLNICDTYPTTPCEAEGEGNTGTYGGDDDHDNSGILKYVVVEFGGTEISTDNEINGISVQGVGDGTTIDYVQIHNTLDDCIEFWGGAVNASHIVCTSPGDDGIDWDLGWRGKMQFAVVQQGLGTGNNGIEADNAPENYLSEPMTRPTISNVTLIGDASVKASNFGALLRHGTHGVLTNVAIQSFPGACLSLRDDEVFAAFDGGDSSIDHTVLACDTAFETSDKPEDDRSAEIEKIFEAGTGNSIVADLKIKDPTNFAAPNFTLESGSPLASGGAAPSDSWFQSVTYIGGFDGSNDWTAGWTHHDAD